MHSLDTLIYDRDGIVVEITAGSLVIGRALPLKSASESEYPNLLLGQSRS